MNLTDEQIDDFFNRNSKFIARRDINKQHYEVVEMMNDDWREVINDNQVVRATFDNFEDAQITQRRLHVRHILNT